MGLVAQRIPPDCLHRPSRRVAIDLHPDIEERVTEDESDGVAHALERDQVKRLVPERGVQAAAGRDLAEQLEVRLAMLDDLVVRRPRLVGMHEDAKVFDQLLRKARSRDLDMSPNNLTFSEPMQNVVAADAHLAPVGCFIDLFDRGGLTAEKCARQTLDRYLEVGARAETGGGRGERARCLSKGELTLRRQTEHLLDADLAQGAKVIAGELGSLHRDRDPRAVDDLFHAVLPSADGGGSCNTVPGGTDAGSSRLLKLATSRHSA